MKNKAVLITAMCNLNRNLMELNAHLQFEDFLKQHGYQIVMHSFSCSISSHECPKVLPQIGDKNTTKQQRQKQQQMDLLGYAHDAHIVYMNTLCRFSMWNMFVLSKYVIFRSDSESIFSPIVLSPERDC